MRGIAPTIELLEHWLVDSEGENLEFKEAKTRFDSGKLTRYCVALANEGGGHVVFGVTDKRPRKIVGTRAFQSLSALKRDLSQRVRLRIDATALEHADGRVVVVTVPPRPIGMPVEYKGAYWMRRGEDLVAMSAEVLKRILDEGQPDYSAQICTDAALAALDEVAVEKLRTLWQARSGNTALENVPPAQLLEDAELAIGGEITYAALILLGTQQALGRHLPQAETIFEYRSSDGSVSYQQRLEFRQGFLLYLDELWELIKLRNEVHLYQDGLFRREIDNAVMTLAVGETLAHLNLLVHDGKLTRTTDNDGIHWYQQA